MAIDPHTKYVVTITAEGKPSVGIECDDPLGAAEAVTRILQPYAEIDRPAVARPATAAAAQPAPDRPGQEPPLCGVHNLPMVGMTGKRGFFWSCHQRLPDGSWCGYKPPQR
jgi:hypothetical protein